MNAADLAGFAKIRKEVEPIPGLKVTLHSLSVSEEEEVNIALSGYPNDAMARATGIQIETLVRAIETLGGKTFSDPKELRDYLKGLQRHVLDRLFSSWNIEFDLESASQIENLKKNSAPLVPAPSGNTASSSA